MVRAIVGANWGDEGKGKITDMLGEKSDILVFRNNLTHLQKKGQFTREEVMPDILLLMNMVSLHFIYFHQEYSISILHVL